MKGMIGPGRIARGSLVALSALISLALAFAPARAATFVAPDDFGTIQAAVDAASPGDTIIIKKCTPFLSGVCGPNGEWH